ncbi:MmyB family transcriptional regulator [Streptomyces sp. NBC_01431]|uniref:MmyB family transcriptional regulator n=1 Tax=Streptomyces sp. NBC_01431 TaxID=2903863 RepID=UPI003FCDDA26
MAYITNESWEVLGGNDLFSRLFPDQRQPQNTMRWMLLHPDAREILTDWENAWAPGHPRDEGGAGHSPPCPVPAWHREGSAGRSQGRPLVYGCPGPVRAPRRATNGLCSTPPQPLLGHRLRRQAPG